MSDVDIYAEARMQAITSRWGDQPDWAIGGSDEEHEETEYAIEPRRGADARSISDELASVIEDLPDYKISAGIIRRTVTYGPWHYVTPEEIRNG